MARERLEWVRSLKAIEREYQVTLLATSRLEFEAARDPTILSGELRYRDVGTTRSKLGPTYVIRMFAEFEAGLRAFWVLTRLDPEPTSIAEIIDRVASREKIVGDPLANAHRTRSYRNREVHDRQEEGEQIAVSDCRSHLNVYLGRLPMSWVAPA